MHRILGVILAGGASRRFGSDKALVPLAGVPLVEHVAFHAKPQVDALAISRSMEAPLTLDLPLIVDHEPAQGPLSGVVSSFAWAEANGFALVATFPCDGPRFPADLVVRLSQALGQHDCAMACSGTDRYYTYGLWRTAALPSVTRHFTDGVRSLRTAADLLSVAFVAWEADDFLNINRPEDLARAEELLARPLPHG